MALNGWHRKGTKQSQALFVRSSPVTPFFAVSRVRRMSAEYYSIDAAIGIIHNDFEPLWAERMRDQSKPAEGHAVILDLANVSEYRDVQYISTSKLEDDVTRLVVVVSRILAQLPSTEADLRHAFAEQVLLARPINQFASVTNRPKFEALRLFVQRVDSKASA